MAEKVNLRPDGFAEGGGLIDDFDGTISDIRFIMTNYDGAITDAIPAARVLFEVDGEETDATLYSVGGKNDFTPDDSGMGLTPLKSKSTLTKTAKFSMLLDSLVECGFPLNRMDEDSVAYLVGTYGHFLRKAVEYKGLKKKEGDRENTVLVCTKLIKLPWETKGGKSTKGKGGKKKQAAPDDGFADSVAGIIKGILIGGGGDMPKKDMMALAFTDEDIANMDDKRAALKLASNDIFLKERAEWTYEDGVLTVQ